MNPPSSLKWHHGIWAFILALVLQLIAAVIVAAMSGVPVNESPHFLASAPGVALQIAVSSGIFALVAVAFARGGIANPTSNLSLGPVRWPLLLLGAIGALAIGVLTDGVSSLLFRLFPEQFDLALLESLGRLFHDASSVDFFWLTLVITVGPAFGEELLFRGILLNGFAQSWKGAGAVLASSLLFGAMHMDMLQGVGAMLIGLYLGYLVYRSGSIWPGIVAHGINNLAVSITARFETSGLRETLETGHSPLVLALAAVVAAFTLVGIEKVIRVERKSAAADHRSS